MGVLDQQEWAAADGQKKNGFQLVARSLEFVQTEGRGTTEAGSNSTPPF